MNKEQQTFTNYDDWAYECVERGYSGPHRVQGHQTFQFVAPEDSTVVKAVWNGQDSQGVIHADVVEDKRIVTDEETQGG